MSNANKIARYLTTIDTAPSYAINILVVKPMAVSATFFFFHTLLKLNDKKLPFDRTYIYHCNNKNHTNNTPYYSTFIPNGVPSANV